MLIHLHVYGFMDVNYIHVSYQNIGFASFHLSEDKQLTIKRIPQLMLQIEMDLHNLLAS